MTHTTDYEALGRGPILPPEPPAPSNLFCPTMGRRMIYAPPYMSLSDQGKAVYWDIYFAGRDDEAAESVARVAAAYAQGRADEREELAALQRQAVAIAHDVREPYWVLAERRGEHRRAQVARDRAIERGYFV